MASSVFMDANILLNFTLKRDSYEESKRVIELAVQKRIQAFITSSIVHIVGYYLTKAYGSSKAKELLLAFTGGCLHY
jgi:predicted nucleic acid-binding protein